MQKLSPSLEMCYLSNVPGWKSWTAVDIKNATDITLKVTNGSPMCAPELLIILTFSVINQADFKFGVVVSRSGPHHRINASSFHMFTPAAVYLVTTLSPNTSNNMRIFLQKWIG
jgi:hypothetical protein